LELPGSDEGHLVMIRKILVPLDFSPASNHALLPAIMLAAPLQAQIQAAPRPKSTRTSHIE
jgi:hypothetical protein